MNIKYKGCAPHIISSRGLDKYVGDRIFLNISGNNATRHKGKLEIDVKGDYVLVSEKKGHVPLWHGDVITLQTERSIRSYVFNETE